MSASASPTTTAAPARTVDVRTPAEFETEHIPGSVNLPLPLLREHAREVASRTAGPLVVVCQSGQRATVAASVLAEHGLEQVRVLEGGIDAWRDQGGRLDHGRARWQMERQVRLVAGSVVLGSVLVSMIRPRARFVAGGIGLGLTYSALSNTCTMADVLGRLPYNNPATVDPAAAVDRLTAD